MFEPAIVSNNLFLEVTHRYADLRFEHALGRMSLEEIALAHNGNISLGQRLKELEEEFDSKASFIFDSVDGYTIKYVGMGVLALCAPESSDVFGSELNAHATELGVRISRKLWRRIPETKQTQESLQGVGSEQIATIRAATEALDTVNELLGVDLRG